MKHAQKHLKLIVAAMLLTTFGCDGPDTIYFTNQSFYETGFLVDGAAPAGPFIDKTYRTFDDKFEFLDDLTSRPDGMGEVVAFSEGRPPFVRNPISWREGKDIVSIPLENEIELDFTVWIVDVTAVNSVSNRTTETINALAFAEERWRIEKVGLVCGDIRIVDSTNDSDAQELRDCDPCNNAYFDDLRNDIGFDAGRMNIYLTRRANTSFGRYFGRVRDIGSDQIIMGMYTGQEDLLMHEIAHNLFLEHVDNDGANFDNKNVAQGNGGNYNKRKFFTEGQTFRAHFHEESALNDTYNARPGLYTTTCIHRNTETVSCPKVQKRIWPDSPDWPAN